VDGKKFIPQTESEISKHLTSTYTSRRQKLTSATVIKPVVDSSAEWQGDPQTLNPSPRGVTTTHCHVGHKKGNFEEQEAKLR